MEKELKQPNDILIATLSAPNADLMDFLKNNITASNTSLLTKDEYKNTPFVKKNFTNESGVFNEKAFDAVYLKAVENFENLSDKEAYDGLKEHLIYGSDSMQNTGKKKRDNSFSTSTLKDNPLQLTIGIAGLNVKADPKLTEEEVAQGNHIWDSENKKWLESTAENRNLLTKAFGKTLVYAKYEKEGTQANPVTGEVGYHYKGEWVKDADGNYFTETLGNRLLLDKEVVTLGDILTEEGSSLNKLDFWDSDGYDKSLGGIAMKTIVQILPYLTPLKGYYGAFVAAMQVASAMPAIYKSFESLVLGENTSCVSDSMTSIENWFSKFATTKSRKGSESFWTVESLGELAADTFGLLYLQRAAAALAPKVLSKFDDDIAKAVKWQKLRAAGKFEEANKLGDVADSVKKLNSVSSGLALGYMGLTLGAEMYNEALKSGYDKRTAGISALATTAALFGIMRFNEGKNGLGTWFLDKTTGYSLDIDRGLIASVAKQDLKTALKDIQKGVLSADKKKIAYKIKDWKRAGADKLHDAFVIGGEELWKGFLVEGVEEVTEEATQDFIKGMVDTMQWLGWTAKDGSFGGWDNVFSKEGMSRYLSTFVGGGLGGALFAAQNKWIDPTMNQLFNVKDDHTTTAKQKREEYELSKIILEGNFDSYIKELDKCEKYIKNTLDSTILKDGDGVQEIGVKGESQAQAAVRLAKEKAYALKAMIDQAAQGDTDIERLFNQHMFVEAYSKILGKGSNKEDYFRDHLSELFQSQLARIADLSVRVKSFKEEGMSPEEKAQKKEIEDLLKAEIDELHNFFDVKHFAKFSVDSKLLSEWLMTAGHSPIISALTNVSLFDYAKNTYNVDIETLENLELKNKIIAEHTEFYKQNITKENAKNIIPRLRTLYLNIFKLAKTDLIDFGDIQQAISLISYIHGLLLDSPTLNSEYLPLLNLAKIDPNKFVITARHNFDLFSKIEKYLDFGTEINLEQKELIKRLINEQAARSGVVSWDKAHLNQLIKNANDILQDENDIYGRRFAEAVTTSEENRGVQIEQMNSAGQTLYIQFNDRGESLSRDIVDIRINSLADFVKQFTDHNLVDSELKERLAELYFKSIVDNINDPNVVYTITNDWEAMDLSPESLIQEFKKERENLNTGSYLEKLNKVLLFLNKNKDIDDELGLTIKNKFNDSFLTEVESFLQRDAVESPIVKFLKKLYIGIHGNSRDKNIFDFLTNKNSTVYDLVKNGILYTPEDLRIINDALSTIRLAKNVVNASIEGTDGIIDSMKHFLEISGEDTTSIIGISKEMGDATNKYLEDLENRLDRFWRLNEEQNRFQNGKDLANLAIYRRFVAQELLAKDLSISKGGFTISLPPQEIPDDEKELYEALEKRLLYLSISFLNALKSEVFKDLADKDGYKGKEELYLASLILKNFDLKKCANTAIKANKIVEILEDQENNTYQSSVSEYWVAKKVLQLLISDRNQILSDIKSVIELDETIYPKFDQSLVLEEIFYQAYDIKNGNDILGYFVDQIYEANREDPVRKKDTLNLHNLLALFGGPGSGKTFLMSKTKEKLVEILGSDFIVTAKAKKKVEDLKKDTGCEGFLITDLLDKFGIADKCLYIDHAIEYLVQTYAEICSNLPDKEKFEVFKQIFGETIIEEIKDKVANGETLVVGYKLNIDKINIKEGDKEITYKDASGVEVKKTIHLKEFNKGTVEDTGVILNYRLLITSTTASVGLTVLDMYPIDNMPTFDTFLDLSKITELKLNIIIDESTLVTPTQIYALSEIARNNKKLILFAGDHRLIKHSIKTINGLCDASFYNLFRFNSAPILTSSYRFLSNLKNDNLSLIDAAVEYWETKEVGKDPLNYNYVIAHNNLNTLLDLLQSFKLQWKHDETSGDFIGDKIDSDVNKFKEDLSTYIIPRVKEGKSVAVVYDGTSEKAEEIKSLFKEYDIELTDDLLIDITNLQGGEYDYLISYKIQGSGIKEDLDYLVSMAYTILSRGKYSTLVLDEGDNPLFEECGIASDEKESEDGYLYSSNPETYNKQRIEELNYILSLLNSMEGAIPVGEERKQPDEKPESKDTSNPEAGNDLALPANNLDELGNQEPNDKPKSELEEINAIIPETSIIQTWYTRLGIDWSKITEDKFDKPINFDDFPLLNDHNHKDSADFILFLKQNKSHLSGMNLRGVLAEFLEHKNRLIASLQDPDFVKKSRFRFNILDNVPINAPYMKLNDKKLLGDRFLVLLILDSADSWITLGLFGYNKEGDDSICKALGLAWERVNARGVPIEFTVDPTFTNHSELLDKIQKYFEGRGMKIDKLSSFMFYTALRNYTLDLDIYNNEDNKDYTNWLLSHGILNEELLKYGRMTLRGLLATGYEISTEPDDVWDPNSTSNPDFEHFKTFFSKYRSFEAAKFDSFKGLEKRTWIVIKQLGTGLKTPVLINEIAPEWLKNVPETDSHNVKGFAFTTITRALKHCILTTDVVSKDPELRDFINKFLTVEYKSTDPYAGAYRVLDFLIGLENLINDFKDKIPGKYKSKIEALLTAINNNVTETAFKNADGSISSLPNSLSVFRESIQGHFNLQLKMQNDDEVNEMTDYGTKAEEFKNIPWIQNLCTNLPGFFFTSSTNALEVDKLQDAETAENYVVSRFFETPRMFFFMDMISYENDSNVNDSLENHLEEFNNDKSVFLELYKQMKGEEFNQNSLLSSGEIELIVQEVKAFKNSKAGLNGFEEDTLTSLKALLLTLLELINRYPNSNYLKERLEETNKKINQLTNLNGSPDGNLTFEDLAEIYGLEFKNFFTNSNILGGKEAFDFFINIIRNPKYDLKHFESLSTELASKLYNSLNSILIRTTRGLGIRYKPALVYNPNITVSIEDHKRLSNLLENLNKQCK